MGRAPLQRRAQPHPLKTAGFQPGDASRIQPITRTRWRSRRRLLLRDTDSDKKSQPLAQERLGAAEGTIQETATLPIGGLRQKISGPLRGRFGLPASFISRYTRLP
jgi:hypothetical protein